MRKLLIILAFLCAFFTLPSCTSVEKFEIQTIQVPDSVPNLAIVVEVTNLPTITIPIETQDIIKLFQSVSTNSIQYFKVGQYIETLSLEALKKVDDEGFDELVLKVTLNLNLKGVIVQVSKEFNVTDFIRQLELKQKEADCPASQPTETLVFRVD